MTRQTMMMKQSLKLKEGGNRKTEEDRERKTKIGRITNVSFDQTEREREKRERDKDGSHR